MCVCVCFFPPYVIISEDMNYIEVHAPLFFCLSATRAVTLLSLRRLHTYLFVSRLVCMVDVRAGAG
jgi:hypothetical protein